MNKGSTKPQPSPIIQGIIMWAVLLASQGMIVLVSQTAAVHSVTPPDQAAPPASSVGVIDPRFWYLCAALVAVAAVLLPRMLLASANRRIASDADLRERAKVILPIWIVRWALFEAITMCGFLSSMLSNDPAAVYPFAAVSLIGFIVTFPNEQRLRQGT